jgi:hypothetical protein
MHVQTTLQMNVQRPREREIAVLASSERRRTAARIAALTRCRPGDPELPELRRRLDALRVADIAAWAASAGADLPGPAEVAAAVIQVGTAAREMGQSDDAAA